MPGSANTPRLLPGILKSSQLKILPEDPFLHRQSQGPCLSFHQVLIPVLTSVARILSREVSPRQALRGSGGNGFKDGFRASGLQVQGLGCKVQVLKDHD